ncbi:MAG: T9SS type A sorting domain-containing protein [Candidatus Zixiibacteriota bacterium]|nr:MAG: T9SS type A sorting domain-containing protein [candidate division Zixibacteria bacterium]
MSLRILMVLVLVLLVLWDFTAAGAPPSTGLKQSVNASTLAVDNTTFINANRFLMFVTNHGSFGRDLANLFWFDYGTWYPYPVGQDTSIIKTSAVGGYSPQYAAGLWLGGYVDGNLRVTVAEYSDEYVPGIMFGGTSSPDNPAFRVYKLYSDSLADNPNQDYLDWPAGQGAPVDGFGEPLMVGDQMLWSSFNDADPDAHTVNAGSTSPLGIEVHHTTYAFDSSDPMGDMVFLRYILHNRGENEISDFYITLWADFDLGQASDDMVACDTLNQMFYTYNADNDDFQYGDTPPAVGYVVLKGPLAQSQDDTAFFDGVWIPDHKNLQLAAVVSYIGGVDPANAAESYNLMQGLHKDGSPLANGTPFVYPGDPVAGTGDLDPVGGEKKIMGSFGPMQFNPGDSQYVLLALVGAQATDRLTSVTLLKSYLSVIEDYVAELEGNAEFNARDHSVFIDANQVLMFVTNYGIFGRDIGDIFDYDCGTWWPYPGDTSDIRNNIDNAADYTPLFHAGLWLGGVDSVSGETRVAMGEYSSEFIPGPMENMTYVPMEPAFLTYKLYRDSLEDNPNIDYTNWPVDLGAPVDDQGRPEMLGTQMLWSVFNDADTTAHTNSAGSTWPLGIEVQQTTWAFYGTEPGSDVDESSSLFIRYKLYNNGPNTIKNMYIGHWSDPDLGAASDDLVGCDTLGNIWFCYNSTNSDDNYGSPPPALGFKLLYGPLVPSPGDEAYFDGDTIPDFENLDMTAFGLQFGSLDPDTYQQVYWYLQGLTKSGAPYTYMGDILTHQASGDPVAGVGDLDIAADDRRMLASSGPFDFRPGDSQFVLVKMAVAEGTSNLNSITEVKALLNSGFDPISDTTGSHPPPPPVPSTFWVSQNYPNPFNPSTRIDYHVSRTARVTIDIYNILGQKVLRLVDRVQPPGEYWVTWDGTGVDGKRVGTGLYLYRFTAGNLEETKKMLLVK